MFNGNENIINKKINDYEGSFNVGDKTKLCSKKTLTIMKGVLTLVIRPNCVLRKGNVIDYFSLRKQEMVILKLE